VRKLDLIKEKLRPYLAKEMISYPVSTAINRPRNQAAELINRQPLIPRQAFSYEMREVQKDYTSDAMLNRKYSKVMVTAALLAA
jgi:hypothetical protein